MNDAVSSLDKISVKYDSFFMLGDLNFDLANKDKCKPLIDLCDIFDMENIIKGKTCFPKQGNASQIDVVLTNDPDKIAKHCNFNCGVSDVHNIIAVQFKMEAKCTSTEYRNYRSFRNLDLDAYMNDLRSVEEKYSETLHSDPDTVNS